MPTMYVICMKCRSRTGNVDARLETTRSGRHIMYMKCVACGTTKCRLVSGDDAKDAAKVVDLYNSMK